MAKERQCHAIKEVGTTRTPSSLLFFDCETYPSYTPGRPGAITHKLRLGVAKYVRYEDGGPSRVDLCRFTTADEFWQFLYGKLDKKRPLWVFAHNLLFDFRLVGGYDILERHHGEQWKLVFAKPPVIMAGQIADYPVRFLDTLNYYRMPLAEVGEGLSLPKGDMPAFTSSQESWYEYCTRDVEIIEAGICHLISLVREHDLGVFGDTISQCAYSAWRRRFMNAKVYIHDDDEVLRLERRSYYGGRAEAYQLGEKTGDCFQLDINSLYPYCMKRYKFPTKLVAKFTNQSPSWLTRQLAEFGAVATVWLDTRDDRYPKRIEGVPYYPVGVFRTTLAGPELEDALTRNHVVRVQRVALYELGDLFTDYVDFFYALKVAYTISQNHAKREVAKLYLNSLYGKFAQRSPTYVNRPEYPPPISWGPFHVVNKIKGTDYAAMAIAGHTLESTDQAEAYNSFPAVSAFVTAAGRTLMDDCKRRAGAGTYYYEDTDSLIVNEVGLDNLWSGGYLSNTALGGLKCDWISDRCHIRGIKDYSIGTKVRLAGVRKDATQISDSCYKQYRGESVWEGWKRGFSRDALLLENKISLSRVYKKRTVNPDGSTVPIEIFEAFDAAMGSDVPD